MSAKHGQSVGEMNGGWAFMMKLSLMLLPIGISSQMWLARTVWVLDERVHTMCDSMRHLETDVEDMQTRIFVLEKNRP